MEESAAADGSGRAGALRGALRIQESEYGKQTGSKRKRRNSMKTIAPETTFETGAVEGNAYTNKFFSVE